MIRTKAELHWNENTKRLLTQAPDKMMYAIARRTLDEVGSSKITPYDTGRMERSMYSSGVKKDGQGYYIGNFTDYASIVYSMGNSTSWSSSTKQGSTTITYGYGQSTNWSRPTTEPQWFDYYWNLRGAGITDECVREYGL